MTTRIHVKLVDEAVDVWAPVDAEEIEPGTFRLPAAAPPDQRWAFSPGAVVVCERRGADLFATSERVARGTR